MLNMVRRWMILSTVGFLLLLTVPDASDARVVRFVVEQTRAFAEGMSFGNVGPYERLDGTAYMEVVAIAGSSTSPTGPTPACTSWSSRGRRGRSRTCPDRIPR
jgi:hypothetical protein